MSQGRGGATVLPILCLLLVAGLTTATEYTVGDSDGWSFNVENWPKGKNFKVGDVLVFDYSPQFHNVVQISDGTAYKNCQAPSGAPVFQTGSDKIKLVKGNNFFICSIPGHCKNGMKIAVDAE